MDKSVFKDKMNRYLTQGLFLEMGYNTELAVYTLDDEDKEYKGKIYPSLKRLYLECEDPSEVLFARNHLDGWRQWKRICENQALFPHIEEWREELAALLSARAIQKIMDIASEDNNFQAAKWLADRGWDKRRAGRPSKEEIEKDKRIRERINGEFEEDNIRLLKVVE